MADQRDGQTIIGVTTEDDRFRHARVAALRRARQEGVPLVLYDLDAASLLNEPLPSAWSAEGAGEEFGSRLTVDQLERLGRPAIARQVGAAREAGVDAYGWLPTSHGPVPLADYARQQRARTVIVPAEQEDCDAFCAVLSGTFRPLDKLAETTPTEVVVVSADGSEETR